MEVIDTDGRTLSTGTGLYVGRTYRALIRIYDSYGNQYSSSDAKNTLEGDGIQFRAGVYTTQSYIADAVSGGAYVEFIPQLEDLWKDIEARLDTTGISTGPFPVGTGVKVQYQNRAFFYNPVHNMNAANQSGEHIGGFINNVTFNSADGTRVLFSPTDAVVSDADSSTVNSDGNFIIYLFYMNASRLQGFRSFDIDGRLQLYIRPCCSHEAAGPYVIR